MTTLLATRPTACRPRAAHEPNRPTLPMPPAPTAPAAGAAERFLFSSNDWDTSCSNRPTLVPRRAVVADADDAGVGVAAPSCSEGAAGAVTAAGDASAAAAPTVSLPLPSALEAEPCFRVVARASEEEEVALRGRSDKSSRLTKRGSPSSSSEEPKTGVKSVCDCLWGVLHD